MVVADEPYGVLTAVTPLGTPFGELLGGGVVGDGLETCSIIGLTGGVTVLVR